MSTSSLIVEVFAGIMVIKGVVTAMVVVMIEVVAVVGGVCRGCRTRCGRLSRDLVVVNMAS
jgi:hypothetical protein